MESAPSGSPQVAHIHQQAHRLAVVDFEAQHEVASPEPNVGATIPYGRSHTRQAQLLIMPYLKDFSENNVPKFWCETTLRLQHIRLMAFVFTATVTMLISFSATLL